MDIVEILEEYIRSEFIKKDGATINSKDNLIEKGILDSLGMMRLISFIEKEFEIKVSSEDMTLENFMSLNSMSLYISERKIAK